MGRAQLKGPNEYSGGPKWDGPNRAVTVTTRGERREGKNEVKKCYERVNPRLPDHIKFDNVGMNDGRYTASSICMNNNLNSVATSMATKHKCMESLKGTQ